MKSVNEWKKKILKETNKQGLFSKKKKKKDWTMTNVIPIYLFLIFHTMFSVRLF